MTWFYLSFADADRARGQQWLGACHVEAGDFSEAVAKAHLLGCNPGGDIRGIEVPQPPKTFRDRLLSLQDLRDLDRAVGGDGNAVSWKE